MNVTDTLSAYRPMPPQHLIAREGYVFIALSMLLALGSLFLQQPVILVLLATLTIFVVAFFRNPERVIPNDLTAVVSPADGRVLKVDRCDETPLTGKGSQRISIFMSVFNVHMNRFPIDGNLKRVVYHPGKFLVASRDKASEDNERNLLLLEDPRGDDVLMVQIAGMVARRIVCYKKVGDRAKRGERCGIIRFGSRVDLYLPLGYHITVAPGDRVRAGSTIIGKMS